MTRAPLFEMFARVPARYDVVNRAITLGLDQRWRRAAAAQCLAAAPRLVVDLCCGTGDLTLAIAAHTAADLQLVGVDYGRGMLALARDKARAQQRSIRWVQAEAARLPFADGAVDCVGIGFGLRNLLFKNPLAAAHLAEVARVLRPGGRFVAVESSQPASRAVRPFHRMYLRLFVQGVGSALSGEAAAYRYLAESAARFATNDELQAQFKAAGFRDCTSTPFFFGAAALHVATR
jgi:demethylmenaquinone methyltransferase / 2-methoxy-6-polyprenyl-1,4-benzoquinol methylase